MSESIDLNLDLGLYRPSYMGGYAISQEELIDVMQDAFSSPHFPTEEDCAGHINDSTLVALALDEENVVGVGAVKYLDWSNQDILHDHFVLQHAAAVTPKEEYRGNGIGSALFNYATLYEAMASGLMDEEAATGCRTQNPAVINHMDQIGGYPRSAIETPEHLIGALSEIAGNYDFSSRDQHVLRETYPNRLYSLDDLDSFQEVISELLAQEVDLLKGDGILSVAELDFRKLSDVLGSKDSIFGSLKLGSRVEEDLSESLSLEGHQEMEHIEAVMNALED